MLLSLKPMPYEDDELEFLIDENLAGFVIEGTLGNCIYLHILFSKIKFNSGAYCDCLKELFRI